jgi:hypothetical protein
MQVYLGVVVVHQPSLALQRGGGIGIQRLMAVEKDLPLQVQYK